MSVVEPGMWGPGRLRHRIRGGEIPAPSAVPWRQQRRTETKAAQAGPQSDAAAGPQIRLGRLSLDADAVFAFAILAPMLFIVQLGTVGAALIAGLTPFYMLLRRQDLLQVLFTRIYLLVFPALALGSFLWSWVPGETFKFAAELCITIMAAMLIGSSRNQSAVIKAMALAFIVYAAAAVLVGRQVGIGVSGGDAFSGLTDSKNLMADIAGAGLLASCCAALISLRQRSWAWFALFAVGAGLELFALVGARSAGALLAVAVALGAMSAAGPLCHAGLAVRGWLTVMIGLCVAVISLNYRTISAALIQFASEVFDKDPTLTGRTYLWYRAQDVMEQTPGLGIGYSAFWIQGNIDAEGLWRYAGIADRGGFNFHNTLVDLRVMLGWPGALAMGLALGVGAILLVRRFVQDATLPVIFWLGVLLYITCRMPIETLGIQQFYHSTLLLFAALSAGLAMKSPAPAVQASRSPVREGINYTRLKVVSATPIVSRSRLRVRARPEEVAPE